MVFGCLNSSNEAVYVKWEWQMLAILSLIFKFPTCFLLGVNNPTPAQSFCSVNDHVTKSGISILSMELLFKIGKKCIESVYHLGTIRSNFQQHIFLDLSMTLYLLAIRWQSYGRSPWNTCTRGISFPLTMLLNFGMQQKKWHPDLLACWYSARFANFSWSRFVF